MNCPQCQVKLNEMRIEGVDMDFCSTCKGLWFDKDEVALMTELEHDMPNFVASKASAKKTTLECPRCAGTHLEEMNFAMGKPLQVDRCPKCRGLWLDKGELSHAEDIASQIGSPHSKILIACQQLKKKGYDVLGARFT